MIALIDTIVVAAAAIWGAVGLYVRDTWERLIGAALLVTAAAVIVTRIGVM